MQILDEVKVVNKNNDIIKRGIIVAMTNAGARVFDAHAKHPYTDSLQFAEWFPFHSSQNRIVLIKSRKEKSFKKGLLLG